MRLTLEAVTKTFGETTAVAELDLAVEDGEFLTLLGPSGCGKTTTLRIIAGFERPTSGTVRLAGRDITGLPPQARGMGMVFQSYALFPHLDVYENVAFGLRAQGASSGEIPGRVTRALELVELRGYERRAIQALSGGQQQRVALARALAPEPPLLLLDEPLSNLDAALREKTRTELRSLLKRLGMTAVFVTHDQEEAFDLSDRIAVMREGRLQQLGTPQELYVSPANAFVAGFVGRANFFEGRLLSNDGDGSRCEIVGGALWTVRPVGADPGPVRVMVRPEALEVSARTGGEAGGLTGRLVDRRFAGPVTAYRVALDEGPIVSSLLAGPPRELPEEVEVRPAAGRQPLAYPAGAA